MSKPVLVQYPPAFGLSSLSPFCIKVEAYLRILGVPYEVEMTSNPGKGPYGKMPVLKVGQKIIADSRIIMDYLSETYAASAGQSHSKQDIALGNLVLRTMEEHIYFAVLYSRWVDREGFLICKQEFRKMFPFGLRNLGLWLIRRRLMGQSKAQGLGRLSKDKIYEFAVKDLHSIETLLKGPFLLGEKVSGFDASLFAFLQTIVVFPLENPIKNAVNRSKIYRDYIDRMTTLCHF